MTGHQINSLVGDLVEMAKAMEERPQLQERIRHMEAEADRNAKAREALEESNNILREHIDELNRKVQEVTRERDDAGFRLLEQEDQANALLNAIRTATTNLGQVLTASEPPKPEPVKEPEPQSTPQWGWPPQAVPALGPVNSPQGQDTNSTTEGQSADHPTSETQQAGSPHGAPAKPYAGKLYIKEPGWVSRNDWLEGGGTNETYDWREGQPVPEGIAA